jgi:phosphoenolpyruvate synthase/pyruvate phosphate dikinase
LRPQRSQRSITPLSEIEFEDWRAFGVKAANLATLRRFDLPDGVQVPDGVAVPFRYYDDFMKVNGFYQRARSILEDDRFQSDPEWQDEQLAEFRSMIRAAPMSNAVLEDLQDAQNRFPQGRALRCRSSTNNEDLPGFSGAGLYDSFTQRVDEGHLVKCVKQVYASTWNLRAVLEREFSRIDQMQTAMGVLIHPNFEGEQANGVAVATDPIYGNTDAIYINTQLGEYLVTNPEDRSVPESLLLFDDGELSVLTRSSRVKPGARLLTDEQVTALRDTLAVINRDFAALYERGESERFAMEIEFKITRQGALAVKQARPWVFSDPV